MKKLLNVIDGTTKRENVTTCAAGTVTEINSNNNVEVDGFARHVFDLHRVVTDEDGSDDDKEENENGAVDLVSRSLNRVRHSPMWTADYVIM